MEHLVVINLAFFFAPTCLGPVWAPFRPISDEAFSPNMHCPLHVTVFSVWKNACLVVLWVEIVEVVKLTTTPEIV